MKVETFVSDCKPQNSNFEKFHPKANRFSPSIITGSILEHLFPIFTYDLKLIDRLKRTMTPPDRL